MDVDHPSGPRHCTAVKRDGTPCKAWAVRGSDPPRCAAHRQETLPGAGETVPVQTAFIEVVPAKCGRSGLVDDGPYVPATMPSVDDVLIDLAEKQTRLSRLIERCVSGELEHVTPGQVLRLFALHGQNASRLGRLLRDRLAMQAESGDDFPEELAQVYDELSRRLGIEL